MTKQAIWLHCSVRPCAKKGDYGFCFTFNAFPRSCSGGVIILVSTPLYLYKRDRGPNHAPFALPLTFMILLCVQIYWFMFFEAEPPPAQRRKFAQKDFGRAKRQKKRIDNDMVLQRNH